MATQLCDIDGVRPAVATVRMREDGRVVTRNLCAEHLAEARAAAAPVGRSLFDEFLSDFFDGFGERTRSGDLATRPRRPIEQVDVTQYFSDSTRTVLQRAAQTAVEWGSMDLDSDHLLWAVVQDDVVRHVLRQLGADADAIAAQVEDEAEKESRTDVAPSLSPDAKAALLAAYDESRQLGASYVGPEHVLLALARDEEDP
ncbi:MAG TPA: Clp protease N-terminal domain-containing protein, partial [Gaiellaceae bacterium]|nr:Clp protease N-terminal domain-containing protein [Gaiellaceae bacterium]